MTAPTPEQLRALADWLDAFGAGTPQQAMPEELSDSADALRAAADQLEAVQRLSDSWKQEGVTPDFWIELNRALRTADTAPQEGRDE